MITIIAHDAGGAEILSSYVREHNLDCLFVLEGPALNIFERKLGVIQSLELNEAIARSDSILCGTSWKSDLEKNAIKLGRSQGKYTIAFLDHWVNYMQRFIKSGEILLPHEIWVGDAIAETMARTIFPSTSVLLVENPYIKDIKRELEEIHIKRASVSDGISVLYISEPLSEHALIHYGNKNYWGYVEEDALRYFLTNASVLSSKYERILIRPHPSESADKYNWVIDEFELPIEIGGKQTLLEEIVECDVVIGCQSTAMVVGLYAGKRVISCIPPGGAPCGLPQQEIEHLQNILTNY